MQKIDDKIPQFTCLSEWRSESFRFEIVWKIQQEVIDNLMKKEDGEHFSSICQTSFCESAWRLEIENKKGYPDHIGMYLRLQKTNQELRAQFSLRLKAYAAKEVQEDKLNSTQEQDWDAMGAWGWSKWLSKLKLKDDRFWHKNFLHVICQVNVKTKGEDMISLKTTTPLVLPPVVSYNSKLLDTGLHSDIIFVVGGKEIQAHRGILATRCEYFNAMFSERFKEATQHKIEISDIDVNIFEAVLKFIYANEVPTNLELIAEKLLIAADKYGLEVLAQLCENQLSASISILNFAELLLFAESYSCSELKTQVLLYIQQNYETVIRTKSWQQLKKYNIQLVCMAFEFIEASKQDSNRAE